MANNKSQQLCVSPVKECREVKRGQFRVARYLDTPRLKKFKSYAGGKAEEGGLFKSLSAKEMKE